MEDPVLVLTQNITQTTTCIFLFPFFLETFIDRFVFYLVATPVFSNDLWFVMRYFAAYCGCLFE